MPSGKTTLATSLAEHDNVILNVEDEWLAKLYPDEILTINDYIKYSIRLQTIISSHVSLLLSKHISVVLDYPANTVKQRNWLRTLYENAGVFHVLHYVEATDEKCKLQLRKRYEKNPEKMAFSTDKNFDAINQYFQAPLESEGFNIVRY